MFLSVEAIMGADVSRKRILEQRSSQTVPLRKSKLGGRSHLVHISMVPAYAAHYYPKCPKV